MKRTYILVAVGVLVIAVIFGVGYYRSSQQQEADVVYIAVVAPLSDKSRSEPLINGVQMYLDKVNQEQSRIHFEKLVFDDSIGDTAEARATAAANLVITDPNNPLVVIGHRLSAESSFAGPIYKENKIPVITASAPAPALTETNEWYFRAIIENNSQGHFIAQYIKNILGYDTVSVIYQDSEYGRTLGLAVLEQAKRLGMNIAYENGYENISNEADRFATLPAIVDEVLAVEDRGMIVLAVGDGDGAQLVYGIRQKNVTQPILEGLITQRFDTDFANLSQGRRSQYLENLWTTQHLIFDTGNKLAQDFKVDYKAKYDMEPDAAAAAYYDAAKIVVKAILDSGARGLTPAEDRAKIRDTMSSFTTLNPDLQGTTGYLYFDPKTRSAVKPVPIGIYDNGQLISAPIQLQAIPNKSLINDIQKETRDGNIILIDGNYYYKTQVVYTGVDINEITNLDMKNSTFTADFYLWFRHHGDLDPSKFEFVNAVDTVVFGTPISESVEEDGTVYRAYRVKANFKSDFNFRAYPFDQQTVNITLRDASQTREQLTFVQDSQRLLPKVQQIEQLEKVGIDGWNTTNVVVYSDIIRSSSTLGNPNLSTTGFEYSAFKVDTTIKRDALNFSIKNLFPIVAVLILAYLAFFIPISEFGMRVSLGINAIMTTAFFSLKVSSDLPSIGYLVALEYIFFMTYTLAVFVIVLAIFIYFADKQSDTVLIRRLTWIGRIVFPLIMIGTGYMIADIIRTAL